MGDEYWLIPWGYFQLWKRGDTWANYLRLNALLPNLDAKNKDNERYFNKLGGKWIVSISVGTVQSYVDFHTTEQRIENVFKGESISFPDNGLKRYISSNRLNRWRDHYLFSHNDKKYFYACNVKESALSPSCSGVFLFRGKYRINLTFHRDYVNTVQEIQFIVERLLSKFLEDGRLAYLSGRDPRQSMKMRKSWPPKGYYSNKRINMVRRQYQQHYSEGK